MKILIVDDEFVSRRKAQKIMAEFGEVDAAADGQEALEAFRMAHDEGAPYDLITMDVNMPEMGGIEALKHIRDWEQEQGIQIGEGVRVVMLTASRNRDTVMPSFKEGCEAYIVKPFDREKFTKVLGDM